MANQRTPGFPGLVSPDGVDDIYRGVFCGIVEDTSDPQQRKRVRVRVIGVHPEDLQSQLLPWAEIACMPAASLAGDFFPIRVGDKVYVQFYAGDRRQPLVTGFWIARPAGLNDVPSDVTVDYARTQQRWVRVDRVGNILELSEVPEESWARMVSGAAELVLDQKDGSITARTASGALRLEVGSVEADAKVFAVTANQFIMSAETKDLLGGADGILQLMSNFEANLHALDPVTGAGVVRLGGYLPRYKGVALPATPGMAFRQTPTVEVRSREVRVGTPAGDTLAGGPVPETERVKVDGVEVLITSAPAVNKPSGATVRILVASTGKITIQSDTEVDVTAPEVKITADTVDVNSTTAINLT